ncbi:MAG TPA: cytochrome c, partial [Acidimicrobiia bacterium]|nr:cytochrome c [Acidimicrobiia bacterium]
QAIECGAAPWSAPRSVPESSDPAVTHGKQIVSESCSACHGSDFNGVSGLGPSFFDNGFIQSEGDADLVVFIKVGRLNNDPENKSGVAMPPYGGNPRLTDADLADVVTFLRILQ